MQSVRRSGIVVFLLLLAPLASAGSAPSIVFFADGETGIAGDGILSQDWPTSNESKVRPILIELAGPATVFVDVEEPPGTHLKGRLFVGLWPDAALAMDARLKVSLWVGDASVAEAMLPVDIDPASAPDPTALVPPDPSDPEGAVYHAIAQVVPLVLQPPTLVNLGGLDVEVPEGTPVRIGLGLVGADGGIPVGAAMALKYDGLLTPSFAYMPWWSADPEAESPQVKRVQTTAPVSPGPSPPSAPSTPPAPASAPGEDSPGIGLLAMVAAMGLAFWRRR